MPALMVVGTTSHAGKSLITAALCRILVRRGQRVCPFKGQNMALNAYVTTDGGEIGFAQALQSWAARVEPQVEMNPILLKPQGDMTSQVIFRGRVAGTTTAEAYYQDWFDPGWALIQDCLRTLQDQFDWIVCEGAGSPVEVNLKHRDLTNMRVALHLNAPTVLVVDIDRGGSFAQVVGTLALLEPQERALVKGIIFNKFRGRLEILQPGLDWLTKYTGIPVLGVVPYLNELFPAEDSLDLLDRRGRKPGADLEIAVIRLPRTSNFTDFEPLEAEPSVRVRWIAPDGHLGQPDVVILPGSKTTIQDLQCLQASGLAQTIQHYAAQGGTVVGICGGYQMLGQALVDPNGLEGFAGGHPGLGLLPLSTRFEGVKVTRRRQVKSLWPLGGCHIEGYEIHQGRTTLVHPLPALFDDPSLGCVQAEGRVWGSYLHGVFENGPWRRAWLNQLRSQKGRAPLSLDVGHYRNQIDALLDRLADAVEQALDLRDFLVVAETSSGAHRQCD
jgi:adenosylcobyric acid synthase